MEEKEIMDIFYAQFEEQYSSLSEEDKEYSDVEDLLLNFLIKRLTNPEIRKFFKAKYPGVSNIRIEDLINRNT
jgi:hypothetical protein